MTSSLKATPRVGARLSTRSSPRIAVLRFDVSHESLSLQVGERSQRRFYRRLDAEHNPFGPQLLFHVSGMNCTYVSGIDLATS